MSTSWHGFLIMHIEISSITKTCLYNFDPLKPHFYIVKLGSSGVYIIFLISAQNIDCGYSLEPPHRGGSNEYPQSTFWAEIWKNIRFFSFENFHFFGNKTFSIFEQACFRNVWLNQHLSLLCPIRKIINIAVWWPVNHSISPTRFKQNLDCNYYYFQMLTFSTEQIFHKPPKRVYLKVNNLTISYYTT